MISSKSRLPAMVALAGSILGLVFASYSTLDYAAHLDRRLHDVHCSIIPGAPATAKADACRAAMYSPYSAVLKTTFWGGVPISLPAVGAFCFFAAFALYLVLARERASRGAVRFLALAGSTPLVVSITMLTISLMKVGGLCQTCSGIYISSALVALGGWLGFAAARAEPTGPEVLRSGGRPAGSSLGAIGWLGALGVAALLPTMAYAAAVPDHRPYLGSCGTLRKPKEIHGALLHMETPRSVRPVLLFEDPLCPTCKAFHQRLLVENVFDRLSVDFALFPLDSECNWMLGEPLHPGACIVSKAVLCGGPDARRVLEWAYDEQEDLAAAGKQGPPSLRAAIAKRWGPELLKCVDSPRTTTQLNRHLHFAADNAIPLSTPQMYLGDKRFCDEDTDIGLKYALSQIAPEVLQ